MRQGILPYKYEQERSTPGTRALGGLPVYLDLAYVMGLSKWVEEHVKARAGEQGYTDSEMVMSLALLNLAGGDCVDDLQILEGDEGFKKAFNRVKHKGIPRNERKEIERRWRKEQVRTMPSPSSMLRYLANFHDEGQEKLREAGKAFIPKAKEHLVGLSLVNKEMVAFVQKHNVESVATLDTDATLAETSKKDAEYCYKGFKAYQPLNVYWAEQGLVLHTEFRDGNVPAGYEQLRMMKESLEMLPEGVQRVRIRSDAAGYQHDLMRYCEMGKNERFGRIEFAIGCVASKEFKEAVREVRENEWQPIYGEIRGEKVKTGREWAEICFVPNAIGHSKKDPEYRYLATREPLEQMELIEIGEQQELPFPTMSMRKKAYKLSGTVTNMDWEGE